MRPASDPALRRLRPWAALPIGGAVLAALLAYAGPDALADAFRGASVPFILLAACAYGWFFVVRGMRWAFLLRSAGGAPGGFVLPAALESLAWMVSTFLPFKAGDAVRAVILSRRRAIPLASVAGTVAMERALDLAGLALAASVGLGVLAVSDVAIPPRWAPVIALAWLLPIGGLCSALALALVLRRRPRTSRPLRLLGQLLDGILAIARRPGLALPAVAWTLAVKSMQILVYVCLLNAFLPGTPAIAAAVVPLFLLSFLVAFTPGHVGTYEAAFVIVFSLVGLAPAALFAAAFAVHMTAIGIVCALGSLSLAYVAASDRGRSEAAPTPPIRPIALALEAEEAAP